MALTTPMRPLAWNAVRLEGGFWGRRQEVNRETTLPSVYQQLRATGRLSALEQSWKPGDPIEPHIFWDSDIAKWLEAACYSLALQADAALEAKIDDIIRLMAAAQQPDGYLNTHFTVVEPQNRWRNLRDRHELYQAGHIIEAAVAHYRATGKTTLLDVARRLADHIDRTFGRGPGRRRGYPGHEEIELALMKLAMVTGERRYRDLAAYFIDERGRQPHYFDTEARLRGEDPRDWWAGSYEYSQCHLPVREQRHAVGHAVRAMYLYSGMADVAADSGNEELYNVLRALWASATRRRMYVTGGVGSSASQERFSYDYDLPNETAYAETCAAIGLVFWAHRMLRLELRGEYGDVMERALYNGVLCGVSLDGMRFFYVNPLAMKPDDYLQRPFLHADASTRVERQPWFNCACCPPNLARLIASLGEYAYMLGDGEIAVHLYANGSAQAPVRGQLITLTQETGYPWAGFVQLRISAATEMDWTLSLRIPGWCREASLSVNGVPWTAPAADGYARITRLWRSGDVVTLNMAMPVERIQANPAVWADGGRVALQRGPIVYCLEQADNGAHLADLRVPRDAGLDAAWAPDVLGGLVVVEGEAQRRDSFGWEDALYRCGPTALRTQPIRAVPYYAWNNRGIGEMIVWLCEA